MSRNEGRTFIVWMALAAVFLLIYQWGSTAMTLLGAPAGFVLAAGLTATRLRAMARPMRGTLVAGVPWLLIAAALTAYLVGPVLAVAVAIECAVLIAIPLVWMWRSLRGFQRLERALRDGTFDETHLARAPRLGLWLFSVVVLLLRHQRAREAVRVLEAERPIPMYPNRYGFWLLESRLRLGDERGARAALTVIEDGPPDELLELARARLEVLDGHALQALARVDGIPTTANPATQLLVDFARADALAAAGRRDDARAVIAKMLETGDDEGLIQDIIGSGRPSATLAQELAAGGAQPFR